MFIPEDSASFVSSSEGLVGDLQRLHAQGAAPDTAELARAHGVGEDDVENAWAAIRALVSGLDSGSSLLDGPLFHARHLKPGSRVGDYTIDAEMARGGMGCVYRAWEAGRSRHVALKFLLTADPSHKQEWNRFHREIAVLSRLNHPHIVQVYGSGIHLGCPYMVMALSPGGSLEDRLDRSGPLDPDDAVRIVAKIALALDYAHSCDLLHRDLKPANVLIDADGEPHLTDFGLTKDVNLTPRFEPGLTHENGHMGTPGYWPPELALLTSDLLGPPTDVYGLGAILYACLTDQPPIHAPDMATHIIAAHRQKPIPPSDINPAVDADLEAICLRCLEKKPASRYATAGELARELQGYLRGERTESPSRLPVVLAALAGVALILGAVVLALALREPEQNELAEVEEPVRARTVPPAPEPAKSTPTPPVVKTQDPPKRRVGPSIESRVWLAKSLEHLRYKRFPLQLTTIEKALELELHGEPADAQHANYRAMLMTHRASALIHNDRNQEAIEQCERALEVDPDHAFAFFTRGIARFRMRQPGRALPDLVRARRGFIREGQLGVIPNVDDYIKRSRWLIERSRKTE